MPQKSSFQQFPIIQGTSFYYFTTNEKQFCYTVSQIHEATRLNTIKYELNV